MFLGNDLCVGLCAVNGINAVIVVVWKNGKFV